MKSISCKVVLSILAIIITSVIISCGSPTIPLIDKIEPIHLDDIHYIVTDEDATVDFFQRHFGAREMAHPGDRFHLARFLSLKWQGPTITITKIGPYADLPADRNQRWLDAKIITPKSEKTNPVYGTKWLAIATASIENARSALIESGATISEDKILLPMEPKTPAFSIYGPDSAEIVIVERPDRDYGDAQYAIDHIQFLVKNAETTAALFTNVFAAKEERKTESTISLRVADANLIYSEAEAFGINPKDISPRKKDGTIRIGLDHLGFIYQDIEQAVDMAISKGYKPIFQPQRYVYKGKPTVYSFTAFATPEDFNIEMVQADGRIGPHSYYMDENRDK